MTKREIYEIISDKYEIDDFKVNCIKKGLSPDLESYITVKTNTNGDSRVAKRVPTFPEFMEANRSHRKDVLGLMELFVVMLEDRAVRHDCTKVIEPYASMFYRDLCNTIEGKMEFMDGEWARIHYEEQERHHLKRYCPDDVNLIDVIEMVCDCMCAGAARSGGNIYDVDIPPEILEKALNNTVDLLKSRIEIETEVKHDGCPDPE